jgi:myo-inositol 2-dehydrogenase/D-chiro-inositol 1-dehydrogenase
VNAEAALHPQLKVMIGFVRRFDASYLDACKMTSTIRTVSSSNSRPPAAAFFRTAVCTTSTWRDGCWATRSLCRFFASGTIAAHRGLQTCGDVDNGVAICEFENGALAGT